MTTQQRSRQLISRFIKNLQQCRKWNQRMVALVSFKNVENFSIAAVAGGKNGMQLVAATDCYHCCSSGILRHCYFCQLHWLLWEKMTRLPTNNPTEHPDAFRRRQHSGEKQSSAVPGRRLVTEKWTYIKWQSLPRSVAFTCAKEQLTETAEWVRDGRRSYRERRASHLVQAVDLEVLRCKGRRVRDSRLKNARKRTSRAEK